MLDANGTYFAAGSRLMAYPPVAGDDVDDDDDEPSSSSFPTRSSVVVSSLLIPSSMDPFPCVWRW